MTTTQAQMQELHEHEHSLSIASAAQEPLPAGWTEHVDSSGATYYHNTADDTTSWERPGSSGRAHPANPRIILQKNTKFKQRTTKNTKLQHRTL